MRKNKKIILSPPSFPKRGGLGGGCSSPQFPSLGKKGG